MTRTAVCIILSKHSIKRMYNVTSGYRNGSRGSCSGITEESTTTLCCAALRRSVVGKPDLVGKLIVQFSICLEGQRLPCHRLERLFHVQCFLGASLKVGQVPFVSTPLLRSLWHHLKSDKTQRRITVKPNTLYQCTWWSLLICNKIKQNNCKTTYFWFTMVRVIQNMGYGIVATFTNPESRDWQHINPRISGLQKRSLNNNFQCWII